MSNRVKQWQNIQKTYPEANFLQSPEWKKMNDLIGHKTIIETFGDDGWCLMIIKNAKRGRYLEIPGGPLINWQDEAKVQKVFAKIREIAGREKCVFVRVRPQLIKDAQNLTLLKELGMRIAPMHLHAEHTVIIDLDKSEDQLLANMRRQTRYEVRRAGKLGMKVEWGDSESLYKEFHAVQAETAARQNFIPPDINTLLAEREAFGKNARIYVAEDSAGQKVAYGLILRSGNEAEYFEAASTELNHKLPGAYALQWQVIRDLKALGIKKYNLWGIAPPGEKNHRYAGVTTFKTGFGGKIVEFVPAHDIIINRSRYMIDLVIETARKKKRHL